MNIFSTFDNDPFFSDVTPLPNSPFDQRTKQDNRNRPIPQHPQVPNRKLDLFGDTFAFMDNLMNNMGQAANQVQTKVANTNLGKPQGQGVSFSTSTVSRMNQQNGGQPRIIQATTEQLRGPDGLERTRKAVRDTGRNIEKTEIAHRLGQRGHKIIKERDSTSGKLVENRELDHVDDEKQFEHEWLDRAQQLGVKNIEANGFNSHADKFLKTPPVVGQLSSQSQQSMRAPVEPVPPKKTTSNRKIHQKDSRKK
ncbi:hypothetical protein I4U23_009600 [Adineta vaga]|nr:hypothetical protein I4U23_009600 [Adineta vaga]